MINDGRNMISCPPRFFLQVWEQEYSVQNTPVVYFSLSTMGNNWVTQGCLGFTELNWDSLGFKTGVDLYK